MTNQPKLPSLNLNFNNVTQPEEFHQIPPTNSIPPPIEDEEEEIEQPQPKMQQPVHHDDDSDESANDEDDTSIDSIKTEEGFEEVDDPDVNEIINSGANPKLTTEKNKNKMGNRSLRILKQIIEPFEDENGNDIFEDEMKKVDETRRSKVKRNPELNKVFGDNQGIIIPQEHIVHIMTAVSENLEISKQTGIIMKTICKVFLAELVEESQKVRDDNGNGLKSPLTPQDVAIAYKRLIDKRSVPIMNQTPYFCDN